MSDVLYDIDMKKAEHDSEYPETKKVLMYGYDTAALVKRRVLVDSNGAVGASIQNMMVTVPYDSIYATYPTDTTEVLTYKNGGSTVATVTVTYTDNTKENLSSVVRT